MIREQLLYDDRGPVQLIRINEEPLDDDNPTFVLESVYQVIFGDAVIFESDDGDVARKRYADIILAIDASIAQDIQDTEDDYALDGPT